MFNLHNYVMNLVKKMINNGVADYKVMKFALDYYEKEVLTDEDMAEIEELLNPVEEETEQIYTEVDSSEQIEEVVEEVFNEPIEVEKDIIEK